MPTQILSHHFLADGAKRLIQQWARVNGDPNKDQELKEAISELAPEEREEVLAAIREISGLLRRAFEEKDEYERDWYLLLARHTNAVYQSPFGERLARKPGVIPFAKDTVLDRAIFFVQHHLAKYMAVCERTHCKKRYYFRTRKGQKYCSAYCSETVNRAGKLRWYHESPNSRKNRV